MPLLARLRDTAINVITPSNLTTACPPFSIVASSTLANSLIEFNMSFKEYTIASSVNAKPIPPPSPPSDEIARAADNVNSISHIFLIATLLPVQSNWSYASITSSNIFKAVINVNTAAIDLKDDPPALETAAMPITMANKAPVNIVNVPTGSLRLVLSISLIA